MASRYSHMPDELRHEYAGQVGSLLWAAEEPTKSSATSTGSRSGSSPKRCLNPGGRGLSSFLNPTMTTG